MHCGRGRGLGGPLCRAVEIRPGSRRAAQAIQAGGCRTDYRHLYTGNVPSSFDFLRPSEDRAAGRSSPDRIGPVNATTAAGVYPRHLFLLSMKLLRVFCHTTGQLSVLSSTGAIRHIRLNQLLVGKTDRYPSLATNGLMRSLGGLVMGSLSAVSEARIGKMRTRARRDCALSIQRLEGSRSGVRWTRVMQIQSRKSRGGSTPGGTRERPAPRREKVRAAGRSKMVQPA